MVWYINELRGNTMINQKQLALSLFVGAALLLLKLISLVLSPGCLQLRTVSSFFANGMWYIPLLLVLLYYFVYSASCYLILRVITYGYKRFFRE